MQSKFAAHKGTSAEASEVRCIPRVSIDNTLTRNSDVKLLYCTTDIEREVLVLKREEQKLTREIKQAAAKGNTAGAKQLAKSLIRLRAQEAKLQASMGQLRGVKTSITVS